MQMNDRKRKYLSALFLAVILFWTTGAFAGEVQGVVTDPLGAVITNATVQMVTGGKVVASTHTDSEGKYHLESHNSGQVRLHTEAPTFAAADSPVFYLSGGNETITRNVVLRIENLSQEIVVTPTATPTSQAEMGVPVDVLGPDDYLKQLDVLEALPSVPGLQITQSGQRGGTTSLFIRGGDSNANKVLLDGIPINDIGGAVEFGDLSVNGLDRVEVLRGPNSVLYGSDAMAGVVSLTTRQGSAPLPQLEYSIDGGNFSTYRQEGALSGAWRKLDYFSDFARFDSSNSLPNNAFHNGSYAGNFGWTMSPSNNLRLTVRRVATAVGLPNAIQLFGLADNAQQKDRDTFIGATYENQTTSKWHNLVRYGASRLVSHFNKPSAVGLLIDGSEFGLPVTIRGANGFSSTGQAFLSSADCCPSISIATANKDFAYFQSDYQFNHNINFLFGYRYEAERGVSSSNSPEFTSNHTADRRNQSFLAETQGGFLNRIFYIAGGSVEKNAVFGTEAVPRLSLAYYPYQSRSGLFRSTKLKFNFGKGIKEPSIFEETSSLFDLLRNQPGGALLIQRFGIRPIRAERSRSYDAGIEQALGSAVNLSVMLFHNQFENEVEFVSSGALPGLGIPQEVADAAGFGATINSDDFRAQGVETELRWKISNFTVRAGYTYLNAKIERSFANNQVPCPDNSNQLCPATNRLFPNVPIGAFSPLVGARPFRRAPHTGFVSVIYNRSRFSALFRGTFVSRRDDSTFLLFSDLNFDNTLLLPNRNLDSAYQKLDFSGSLRLTNHVSSYISMENLFSQHYEAAFGFPSLPFTVRSGIKITLGGESWRHK